MKKIAFVSVILSLALILSSCSIKIKGNGRDTSSEPVEEKSKVIEINVDTEYNLNDDVKFSLVRASKTPIILDTRVSGKGYTPYSTDSSYIDLIFDVTNSSSDDFDCNESIKVDLSLSLLDNDSDDDDEDDKDDDSLANMGKFVGENDGWAAVTTFSKAVIPAGETVRVHYFVAYPDMLTLTPTYNFLFSYADTDTVADASVGNEFPVYKFSYKASQGIIGNSQEIKLKETFTIENHANITLEDVKYSTKLLPTSTWGSYTYYEVKEYGKTFLTFKFTVENLSENVIPSNASIHGLIINDNELDSINDLYYTSGTILEESNRKDLTQAGAIEVGKKNTIYVLFEVPTAFEELDKYTVTFMAGGNFYTYTTETDADTSSDASSY